MIGVFDSGSGGLSVLKEIRERLPLADIVYLGDIKNAPYGNKSKRALMKLTVDGIRLLLANGANKIVSACNSVAASMVLSTLDILGVDKVDMIEMVGPTVKSLKDEKEKILLVGTAATVKSRIYQNGFSVVDKKINCLPIKDLAGAIEFGEKDEVIERIIFEDLKNVKGEHGILLLACTHYPLVRQSFEKVLERLGKKMRVVDPAEAVSMEVERKMSEEGEGRIKFMITSESKVFGERVKKMFAGENIMIEVVN